MTTPDDDADPAYRQSAEVLYHELQEYAEFARKLHAEYGKWLITTLYLVHAGAIAGLLFKGTADARPPYLPALWLFVAGLVLALIAGFCAWVNLSALEASKMEMADHRMLLSRQYWPTTVPHQGVISGFIWAAVVFGILSLLCIPIGAAVVWCLWR